MEQYVRALESFEQETRNFDADYIMSAFIGFEADGGDAQKTKSNFRQRVNAGWAFVKEKAGKILTFIISIPGRIVSGLRTLGEMIRRIPSRIKGNPDEAKKVAAEATKESAKAEKGFSLIRKIRNLIHRAKTAKTSEDMEEVEAELTEVEKEAQVVFVVDENGNGSAVESFLAGIAMEADAANKKRGPSGFIDGNPLKALFDKLTQWAKKGSDEAASAAKDAKTNMDADANASGDADPKAQNQKQRIWSRIARALGSIGRFFAGIPGRLSAWFKRVFHRTETEKYDGPNPMADDAEPAAAT